MKIEQLNEEITNLTMNRTKLYVDYMNVSLLPAICFFGIITNCLNVIILIKKELRENSLLKNYLFISIADFLFCLIEFPIFLFRCGSLCSYAYSYPAKFYEIYFYLFSGYVFACFSVLLDITIAFSRLLLFYRSSASNNYFCKSCINLDNRNCSTLKIFTCLMISIILNIPENLLGKVPTEFMSIKMANMGLYEIDFRDDYRHLQKNLFVAFLIVKGPVTFITIAVVNAIIVVKFASVHSRRDLILTLNTASISNQNHQNAPSSLNFDQQRRAVNRENRITLMIVLMCLIYIFGNLLDTINLVLFMIDVKIYTDLALTVVIGNSFLFLSHAVSIFILYKYNRLYRASFKSVIVANLRQLFELRFYRAKLNKLIISMRARFKKSDNNDTKADPVEDSPEIENPSLVTGRGEVVGVNEEILNLNNFTRL